MVSQTGLSGALWYCVGMGFYDPFPFWMVGIKNYILWLVTDDAVWTSTIDCRETYIDVKGKPTLVYFQLICVAWSSVWVR